jgi:A/G-specific adenine glycosylase
LRQQARDLVAGLRVFRRRLLNWYDKACRALPWRLTTEPYRVWVSEVMLQQTRVAAVLPYYERFLERFPDIASLASASEQLLLETWSGLGYYSRARNMQKAARSILTAGGFPGDYESIRELDGVGDYTAAAIASICFGLPHAVLDGNVLRVLTRLTNDSGDIRSVLTRRRLAEHAQKLLDRRQPGRFNQALMELGATICVPRLPRCTECPISGYCEARSLGTENQLPIKLGRLPAMRIEKTILIIRRNGRLLLSRRPTNSSRLAGFWELPEANSVPEARHGQLLGGFRHSITNHDYRFTVVDATLGRAPRGFRWVTKEELATLPLTTASRKALEVAS